MKILKLKLYQETACYKKPFATKVAETYPLPPYSTAIGMFHKILQAQPGEYFPMNISIQGSYEGIFSNYQNLMMYKGKDKVTSMPRNVHQLLDVNLIIHVQAENETIDKIYKNIKIQFLTVWLLEETEHSKYLPKNLAVIYNDRIHRVILRLEAIVAIFFVISLHGRGVFNQGDYDVSIACRCLLHNKHTVSVENTGIDHALAFHFENERLLVRHVLRRDREVAVDVLLRENRLTGCDCTDDRNIDHLSTKHIKRFI